MLTIEEDGKDTQKATNEIGVFIPTMDLIPDISGRTVTVDALLTQTAIATYLHDRGADFLFVAKGNQKTLSNDIKAFFAAQPLREPDFAAQSPQPAHGRIEKREIWTATEPVAGISFPWVEQVFLIKRTTRSYRCGRNGKPARIGEPSVELVHGITSHTPQSADAEAVLGFNRGHWSCENRVHWILDDAATWNEDKCRVRSGHGPENLSCLRRLAIGLILGRNKPVRPTIEKLNRNPRLVLDYLRLSQNTRPRTMSAAWTQMGSPPHHGHTSCPATPGRPIGRGRNRPPGAKYRRKPPGGAKTTCQKTQCQQSNGQANAQETANKNQPCY